MTTRIIEDCFDSEILEEKGFTRFVSIRTNARLIIIDPYMLNLPDLTNTKLGKVALVRARRPAWGKGDLHKYIYVIN